MSHAVPPRLMASLGVVLALCACAAPAASPEPSPSTVATSSAPTSPSAEPPATATPGASPGSATPAWQQLSAGGGPAAREDHTWTVDPSAGAAYLFGGRDGGTVYGDLWAYDLATDTWSELAPAQPTPPARFGHEAVWVEGIGVVVFAGQQGATFFNDLWALDPSSGGWRQLPADGALPVPRYGTCASLGPDGRLWISHGFTTDGTRFADTVAYDFASGSWTDETPAADRPVNRCLHGCWWTDDDRFTLYAGQTTGITALGDLWQLSLGERPGTNSWTQLTGALPPERNLYARARVDGATLVFGGQALDGSYIGGMWRFVDGDDGAQPVEVAGEEPAGRAGAEMIWDAARERLMLFGGKDADGALDDLWAMTGAAG